MELGDFAEFKALAIEVGSVFKMTMYPADKVTPKRQGDSSRDKYFVVIGKTEDAVVVGSLLINTNINSRLFHIIGPYQHCLSPATYGFLNGKERYVSCYEIKKFPTERVIEKAEYIGVISQEDLDAAIELAKMSPINDRRTLKMFNLTD